jgi:hypothetical protein
MILISISKLAENTPFKTYSGLNGVVLLNNRKNGLIVKINGIKYIYSFGADHLQVIIEKNNASGNVVINFFKPFLLFFFASEMIIKRFLILYDKFI